MASSRYDAPGDRLGGAGAAVARSAQRAHGMAVLHRAARVLQAVPKVSRAAELLRLDRHSAWEIKARAVDRVLARRAAEPISNLGLDAKNFGRRQDYATVLADPAGKLVIEGAAGRTHEATAGLLADALQPT